MPEIQMTQQLEVASVEELEEVSSCLGWDILYSQLGPLESTGKYLEGAGDSLIASREILPAPISLRTSGFAGHIAIANYRSRSSARINGMQMRPDQLFMASPGSEVELISQGSGSLVVTLVPLDRVEKMLADNYSQFMQSLEKQQIISHSSLDNCSSFRSWFDEWTSKATSDDSAPLIDEEFVLGEISDNALNCLIKPLVDSGSQTIKPDHVASGICRLIDLCHTDPKQVISIENMTKISGLRRRNLFYHFKKRTGLTPQHYYNRIRLNGCRNEILRGQRSITAIALDYNFHHLGEFSALYKSVYGELPSASRTKLKSGSFIGSKEDRHIEKLFSSAL